MLKIKSTLLLVAVSSAVLSTSAAVRLPHVFGDNMVLQRGQRVPVWGKADNGKTWVAAVARIEGESVLLTAEGVTSPKAMRFAAYNGSTPNLVNGAGLPAGPFRWSGGAE